MRPIVFLVFLSSLVHLTSCAIRQVVYVSHSVEPSMSHENLQDILLTCRRRNHALDVTGLLLYRDGCFCQLLEGSHESIQSVMRSIRRDHRHSGMLVVLDREVETRDFPSWNIAFRNLQYTREMNEWADEQSSALTEEEQKIFDETLAAVYNPPQMSSAIAKLIQVYQRILMHMEPHPTLENQWSRANKIGHNEDSVINDTH